MTPWDPVAYPLTPWDLESESSINSRTFQGQFVLFFSFERVGGNRVVTTTVVGSAVHVFNQADNRKERWLKGPSYFQMPMILNPLPPQKENLKK